MDLPAQAPPPQGWSTQPLAPCWRRVVLSLKAMSCCGGDAKAQWSLLLLLRGKTAPTLTACPRNGSGDGGGAGGAVEDPLGDRQAPVHVGGPQPMPVARP